MSDLPFPLDFIAWLTFLVLGSSWCDIAFQNAKVAYLQALPPIATQDQHEIAMNTGMNVFRSEVIGSHSAKPEKHLRDYCISLWKNSRRRCEAESLTGHLCSQKFHEETALHSTTFLCTHACNCGHSQSVRDDPFALRLANRDYYRSFGCETQPGVTVLHGTPSLNERLSSSPSHEDDKQACWSLVRVGPAAAYSPSAGFEKRPGFMSGAYSLFQWYIPVNFRTREERERRRDEMIEDEVDANVRLDQDLIERQKAGIADVCLPFGRLFSYATDRPAERADRRHRAAPSTKNRQQSELIEKYQVVLGFLGVEYECPLGHRFFVRGKGRGPKNAKQQDHSSLLSHDLPVLMQCPCNTPIPSSVSGLAGSAGTPAPLYQAQLMRLYVVTPDSDALLTLNPVVKTMPAGATSDSAPSNPSESEPGDPPEVPETDLGSGAEVVFTTGVPGGITLPRDSLIVLRLPYIYTQGGSSTPLKANKLVLSRHYAYFLPPKA